MIPLIILSTLTGVMLGLHYKVLILIPAIVIGSAATLGIGMALSNSVWSILLAVVLAMIALQTGYLAGTVIRFVIARARVRKDSPGTIAMARRAAR